MKKHCIICDSTNNKVIYNNYPGYIEDNFYDIYSCQDCDSQFVIINEDTNKIYDIIYSSGNSFDYDRYYKYAQLIKSKKKPLEFLAYNESTYYPVYKFLKAKKNLKILEVGCGYGYLSYALNSRGFKVTGIDISAKAVEFALRNFENKFLNTDIEGIAKLIDDKFDLIIATEVIEHLSNPNAFLEKCIEMLNNNGNILLTTPNKDYSPKNRIWQTDLPPVHISWINKKGMGILAQNHNLQPFFTNFSKYYSKSENKIVKYLLTRKSVISKAKLNKEGIPNPNIKKNLSKLHKWVAFLLHRISLFRNTSNFIYNIISGEDNKLGVILQKTLR